jgi:hypothetical protein
MGKVPSRRYITRLRICMSRKTCYIYCIYLWSKPKIQFCLIELNDFHIQAMEMGCKTSQTMAFIIVKWRERE